jgi:hypothetical protein
MENNQMKKPYSFILLNQLNMKTILTLFCLIAFITSGFATVRTVSNHPAGGAQYASLQAAFSAAVNGDTLLLEGTNIPYNLSNCNADWNKALTVIGIGFNPDKQLPKKTQISATPCYDYLRITAGGSGSKFYGIEFITTIGTANQALSNLVFENCKFNSHINFEAGPTTNFAFRNCIFDGDNQFNLKFGTSSASANGTVSNCVFDGYIEGGNSPLASVLIEHCLFLSSTLNAFSNLHYATISNNIFFNRFPGGTSNSTYLNNLCRVAGTFPPNPASGNTASGNIENTDPQFVSLPFSTLYNSTQDYQVQVGSAAINAASNGTDIGLHGGYTNFSERGEVLINGIIREMNILNTSVAPNGTLNVQLHAGVPHTD